ncbi:MAG: tryptophan synthase subunit alpha [Nitrososphaerota archaeon]
MNEIEHAFQKCKSEKRMAIIPFITAGDPNPSWTLKIVEKLNNIGADIIELGVPFSDPIADGVTIQSSSERALKAGVTLKEVLKIAGYCKKEYNLPIVLLSYFNPLYKMGLNNFFENASKVGINGVIVPDLPVEEAGEYIQLARLHDISTIFLASPTTSDERLEKIIKYSTGFTYLISVKGVTGPRERISEDAFMLIQRVRKIPRRPPIAIGFGISSPLQVKLLAEAGSDGVIIGSALIKIIEQNLSDLNYGLKKVEEFLENVKEAGKIDNFTLREKCEE